MVNIDKIKNLAREKGIKIKHICAEVGRAETYLSNIKNGQDRMTPDRLEKIANILGTTAEYLTDKTEQKEKPTIELSNDSHIINLGEKLRQLRYGKNLTQQQVADRLKIDVSEYKSYEDGASEPNANVIKKIARLYGISIDYLLDAIDENEEKTPRRKLLEEQLKGASFALLRNPDNDSDELTDDELEEIVGLIHYVKSKKDFRPKYMDWKDPK